MPTGSNQKLKLYYLSRIMLEKTDDSHFLTLPQIQGMLSAYDVTADRKTLYQDIQTLSDLGLDIIGEKHGKYFGYHVGNKHFDIAELKLLVDSVQASKFITAKKSSSLIKKLSYFASDYEAGQLKRQVMVTGRVKTMNESIYYIVDDIHKAMIANKKIRFMYMKWTADKKLVPRKEEPYEVSPWALTWDDENYYLIAYSEEHEELRHYRVDKMKSIEILAEKRIGKEEYKNFDIPSYSKQNFGMFSGEVTRIRLRLKESLVGVLFDRFGTDIIVVPSEKKEGYYEACVNVALSTQFYGWLFALGGDIQLIGPEKAVDGFEKEMMARLALYLKEKS